ncbi:putative thiosulfate sulfurtransferase, mitochondrial [Acanthaster planci]|uniref:Sulfurtransferase n=1 Tax=Acanthaster planci TaxID=133434 RepID=A0A8B7YPM0_ACAPL|nr:putative thiosulfate sulfurtransferase, mitochondrial [Acanthaster planci]
MYQTPISTIKLGYASGFSWEKMATTAILNRLGAVLSGKCYGVRAASVACKFLGDGPNNFTQQTKGIRCSPYNEQHPGKLSITTRLAIHRYLSTETSQLEDADNVYFDGLVKRIKSGDMQMIDVRDASEIKEFGTIIKDICHIPVLDVEAALQLSDDEFRAKYGRTKPEKSDDNIVFTCKKGIRSLKARDTARSLGFKKARHYPGGWMEWGRKNNLPYPKE